MTCSLRPYSAEDLRDWAERLDAMGDDISCGSADRIRMLLEREEELLSQSNLAKKMEDKGIDIKAAIEGVQNFFDGEHFSVQRIVRSGVDEEMVNGQFQQGIECKPFDHCYVNQGGGGITGDDFHGTVYFHIGSGDYLAADY